MLIHFNDIEGEKIFPDMELKIPDQDVYIVKPGDTLSEIAQRFNIPLDRLMARNKLNTDKIHSGQSLSLPLNSSGRFIEYAVQEGDTLWEISLSKGTTVESILTANDMLSDRILPGMILSIPLSGSAQWASFNPLKSSTPAVRLMDSFTSMQEKGPWFGNRPLKKVQPSLQYSELSQWTPIDSFHRAETIISELDKKIEDAGQLSQDLKGWRIVIDPGHGGLDPGALVESRDGNGHSVFFVEDEYAYDVSLRLYSLLKQHGADSFLTIISPNHHIRSTPDASATFVNQKNEVYNSSRLNQTVSWQNWPRGGTDGLRKRKITAREWLGPDNGKTLFLSIHCDNTEGVSFDNALLTWGENRRDSENSRILAEEIAPYLGGETVIREQELEVLKNNPAETSLLIEIRNIADSDNSWILRKEDLRNGEVQSLFEGIRAYILSR